jgi:hypothetical protein
LVIDLDSQNDLRVIAIDVLDFYLAGTIGRPIRERYAVAILGLIKPDRTGGQIKFDIDLMEEILPKEKGDVVTEVSLTGDDHLPILVRGLTNPELVEMRELDIGFAAEPEKPITTGASQRQAQPYRRRAQDQALPRPGVQHDADLPAVDGTIDDELVMFQPNRPFRDPYEFAFGRRSGADTTRHCDADDGRCDQKSPLDQFDVSLFLACVAGSPSLPRAPRQSTLMPASLMNAP